MDETTKAIVERITITYAKPTRIPSGQVCSKFYDTLQLSPNDLARLAALAMGDNEPPHFDMAVGLAYTGILFASAVAGGRKVGIIQEDGRMFGPDVKGLKIVIVDDVVHLGQRLLKATTCIESEGGTVVGYACIVDRSQNLNTAKAAQHSNLQHPLWSAFQDQLV